MTQYRKPTAADIGKTVEVFFNGEWMQSQLTMIIHRDIGTECELSRFFSGFDIGLVRIPVTTAADELLVAADMLNECQHDFATEVLRIAGSMDEESLRRLLRYKQGDTISVFETMLNELEYL